MDRADFLPIKKKGHYDWNMEIKVLWTQSSRSLKTNASELNVEDAGSPGTAR